MCVPRTNIKGESDREQSSRSTCVSHTHYWVGQGDSSPATPTAITTFLLFFATRGDNCAVCQWRVQSMKAQFLRSATTATAIYIQYFCKNVFSGGATTGVPSGVKGGGTRRLGLEETRMPLARR